MAQKFGGKFSPNNDDKSPTKPDQTGGSGRANLLFFAPLPLLVTGFSALRAGDIGGIIGHYGSFLILILAAWLLREGHKAEAAFKARKSARRPAFPRKIIASILTGIALGMVASISMPATSALFIAVFASALHSFSFGLDPLKNKGMRGFDAFANDRVATAVDAAEDQLGQMEAAIKRTGDRALQSRVNAFAKTARKMFRTVQDDPRDLTAARKYLGIYLRGATAATIKFADLYRSHQNAAGLSKYTALLDDLENNFKARQKQLMLDDQADLDIDIEVLRERLQAEGVKTDQKEM